MRRVVITGLGIVSCLGNNQEEVHQSLLNSKSGISNLKRSDRSEIVVLDPLSKIFFCLIYAITF